MVINTQDTHNSTRGGGIVIDTWDTNYSIGEMIINTWGTTYSIGGMVNNTQDTNYSNRGMQLVLRTLITPSEGW